MSARQKLADFDHDVMNHQPATVRFSGDEINTLIAHNPDLTQTRTQIYLSMTGSNARIQASFPTDDISHGMMKGPLLQRRHDV